MQVLAVPGDGRLSCWGDWMYWNLSPEALGITGRQSELIELALTYGFEGIDLDIRHFTKQVELRGLEHAVRFLRSGRLKIGTFSLPVRWDNDAEGFQQDLDQVHKLLEPAAALGAKTCYATIKPASDTLPYHENFESHRERLGRVADLLAPYDMRLGLALLAPAVHREGHRFPFISSPDALLTLRKTTSVPNLGILVDLWHWHVGGGTLDQLRELSPQQIVTVRLASIPEDAALESITEQQRVLPVATGPVDNAGALRVLNELGYRGPVVAYPHPSRLRGQTRDRIVQRTADALETLWTAAALEKTTSRLLSHA